MRTGSLLAVLTLATAVAARIGTAEVAAHQVVFQVWFFLSLVLDALAIAAQALVGRNLTVDVVETEAISRRLLLYGLGLGVVVSGALGVLYPWLPGWFSSDAEVVSSLRSVYLFLVLMQPLNALVFVWDGIVIGATDFGYLAWTMAASAAAASIGLVLVGVMGWGLPAVWWSIVVLMVGRALTQAWWHRYGPFSAARGPSPSSRAA